MKSGIVQAMTDDYAKKGIGNTRAERMANLKGIISNIYLGKVTSKELDIYADWVEDRLMWYILGNTRDVNWQKYESLLESKGCKYEPNEIVVDKLKYALLNKDVWGYWFKDLNNSVVRYNKNEPHNRLNFWTDKDKLYEFDRNNGVIIFKYSNVADLKNSEGYNEEGNKIYLIGFYQLEYEGNNFMLNWCNLYKVDLKEMLETWDETLGQD